MCTKDKKELPFSSYRAWIRRVLAVPEQACIARLSHSIEWRGEAIVKVEPKLEIGEGCQWGILVFVGETLDKFVNKVMFQRIDCIAEFDHIPAVTYLLGRVQNVEFFVWSYQHGRISCGVPIFGLIGYRPVTLRSGQTPRTKVLHGACAGTEFPSWPAQSRYLIWDIAEFQKFLLAACSRKSLDCDTIWICSGLVLSLSDISI